MNASRLLGSMCQKQGVGVLRSHTHAHPYDGNTPGPKPDEDHEHRLSVCGLASVLSVSRGCRMDTAAYVRTPCALDCVFPPDLHAADAHVCDRCGARWSWGTDKTCAGQTRSSSPHRTPTWPAQHAPCAPQAAHPVATLLFRSGTCGIGAHREEEGGRERKRERSTDQL